MSSPLREIMKERPIIFSGDEVRAILDGRKTMTRRVVQIPKWLKKMGPNLEEAFADKAFGVTPCLQVPCSSPEPTVQRLRNPWMWPEPSHLWVRETWTQRWDDDKSEFDGYLYAADGAYVVHVDGGQNADGSVRSPWKSPIHMPREASRLTLEITGVRVQRLNEISDEDAKAEGIIAHEVPVFEGDDYVRDDIEYVYPFRCLWDKINGKRHPWASNPWCWVVEFKPVCN